MGGTRASAVLTLLDLSTPIFYRTQSYSPSALFVPSYVLKLPSSTHTSVGYPQTCNLVQISVSAVQSTFATRTFQTLGSS